MYSLQLSKYKHLQKQWLLVKGYKETTKENMKSLNKDIVTNLGMVGKACNCLTVMCLIKWGA